MARTPDSYLTPNELDARADALARDTSKLPPGCEKDRAFKEIQQDRRMADMKRIIGKPEDRTQFA